MIDTSLKSVLLKDVIYFQEGPGLRNWQYGSSGVPFLNIRTITDEGTIDKSLCQFVKQHEFEGKYEHFLLEEGDYVVSSSGTLGKLAEIQAQDLPLMLNTSVIRFRPLNPEVLERAYLKWFIKSPLYLRQIQKASTGTAIKNYGPSHLKQMVIPLPPLEEQRRIAAILDKADAIRRKRQEAIRLTEELLRSLFLDMFGDPVTNPKGWEVKLLGDVCTVIAGQHIISDSYNNNLIGVPYLTGPADFGTLRPVISKWTEVPKVFATEQDVLLTVKGNGVGKSNLGCNAAIGRQLMAIRPNKEIEQLYLYQFIKFYEKRFLSMAQGATVPGIGKSNIAETKIPLPPIEAQSRFAALDTKTRSYNNKTSSLVNETNNLFNSLLQRAFRGEL